MATEKLLKALVSGPAELLDEAIHKLILDREFHPLSACSARKERTPSVPRWIPPRPC